MSVQLSDLLTVITNTNVIPSAPRIDVIQKMYNGLLTQTDITSVVPMYVFVDYAPAQTVVAHAYSNNIRKFLPHACVAGMPINKGFLHPACVFPMVTAVKTPYILFMEHDWLFRERIDFKHLISVMQEAPESDRIDLILFNKRRNKNPGGKRGLLLKTSAKPGLSKTTRYSNNPHLAKRAVWDTTLRSIALHGHYTDNPSMERRIVCHIRNEQHRIGWDAVHAKYCFYMYGDIGHPAAIRHLDGRFHI